ncbi:hypothetical protein [Haloarchaeobius sp. TZWSO28]|uniref:hypothetical protein n=1 Tax=Haloarchaeobius sp. TZWSO28 TaxID=3446119 RepID=UPI003EB78772
MKTSQTTVPIVAIVDGLVAVVGAVAVLLNIGSVASVILAGLFGGQGVLAYGLFRGRRWAFGGSMVLHGFYALLGVGGVLAGSALVGAVVVAVNLAILLVLRGARPARESQSVARALN